jgi:hypothetical protein
MTRRRFAIMLAAAMLGPLAGVCRTASAQPAADQGLLCRRAIQAATAGSALPPHMLSAIARVESGRRDPATGQVHPWPWTINAEGRGNFFDSKAEAIAYATQLQQRGVRSFDVGCMQVNLMHHPDAFLSLDEAFDPAANARYAVKFLNELHDKTGSWETASAWYHSANPQEGLPYRGLVVAAMDEEAKVPDVAGAQPVAFGMMRPGLPPGMRGISAGTGRIIMLGGASGGAMLPRTYAASASPAAAMGGMQGPVGRALDMYRMQPVAIARSRMFAMR